MKLTKERKQYIDGLSYIDLLSKWRFAPIGDLLFEGETGEYLKNRMSEMASQPGGNDMHVAASKKLGWR